MGASMSAEALPFTAPDQSSSELMVVSSDWALYFAFMGHIPPRMLGGATIYFCDAPFGIRYEDGAWRETNIAVAAPFVQHELHACSPGQRMLALMLEADAFYLGPLDGDIRVYSQLLQTLHAFIEAQDSGGASLATQCHEVAATLLEGYLQKKALDPRIGAAVSQIRRRPWEDFSASVFADSCCLSFSRFLHLFKEETGLTFRRYVAWKRARSVLEQLRKGSRLTDIALDAGYLDSSHFSHSIRRAYGLQAKEMLSRCSGIPVYLETRASSWADAALAS